MADLLYTCLTPATFSSSLACLPVALPPHTLTQYPELAKQSVDNIKCANPELSLPRSSPDTPTTPASPTSPGSSPTLSPPTPASPPEPSAGASVAGSHSGGGRAGVTVLGRGLNWEIVHGNALSGERERVTQR